MDRHVTPHDTSTIAHAHSSEHNEHYTPEWLADAGRYVLGGFTLDPFSSPVANRTIKAEWWWCDNQPLDGVEILPPDPRAGHVMGSAIWRIHWSDPHGDALASRVWCNPPGGRLNAETLEPLPRNENGKQGGPGLSSAGAGFAKLSHEWVHGRVDCALFLCFSLNVFRTAQSRAWSKHFPQACAPTSFPFVCFRDRIHFDTVAEDGTVRHGAGAGAPQDSALVLLPTRGDASAMLRRFEQIFAPHGHVRL